MLTKRVWCLPEKLIKFEIWNAKETHKKILQFHESDKCKCSREVLIKLNHIRASNVLTWHFHFHSSQFIVNSHLLFYRCHTHLCKREEIFFWQIWYLDWILIFCNLSKILNLKDMFFEMSMHTMDLLPLWTCGRSNREIIIKIF